MRRLKNPNDVEKIEAVLFEVSEAFPFVPFKTRAIFVYILCLQSRFFLSTEP